MKIGITGATGLLGRNLLFEILKQHWEDEGLKIYVFGRGNKGQCLLSRIVDAVEKDGKNYLNLKEDSNYQKFLNRLQEIIEPIDFDLAKPDLSISTNIHDKLKRSKIEKFFHFAALTDFRSTPMVRKVLERINIDGTGKIIELAKSIGVKEFLYSGSAYSAGITDGEIMPDYENVYGNFRNYYEYTKLKGENLVNKYCREAGIRYQIFRLTGIGGRLIEEKIGHTTKYDIFYGWMLFFVKQREKIFLGNSDKYDTPLGLNLRITLNKKGGMNIVPSDYAAKMIYYTNFFGEFDCNYHIVNDIDIPNETAINTMLNSLKITGWRIVNEVPKDKNKIEKLYYKGVGQIFTPYVLDGKTHYNTDNLDCIKKKSGLKCPLMTVDNFKKLVSFAIENHFGDKNGNRYS